MRKPWSANDNYGCLNIVCDFDGTITPLDTTDLILSRFAPPRWEEVEKQWVAGLISSRECMYRQIRMLKVDKKTLDAFIDKIPLTAGFEEFISFAESRGLTPRIVSDGLDYVIGRVLALRGFEGIPVTANHLVFTDDGYQLEFPFSRSNCGSGVCKCAVAGRHQAGTILIGDGRSDLCLAGQADFVLARRGLTLESHCREKGLAHLAYDDFHQVTAALEQMFSPKTHSGHFSHRAARPQAPYAASLEIKQ